MNFRAIILCSVALALAACDKLPKPKPAPTPTPTPVATPTPTPTPAPTPTPFALDKSSQAVVLCYHRFEDKPHDSLAIKPAEFEAQMQALKDGGITVIPMEDFLAWRRGEKNIPAKSVVISIDDGYLSGYRIAWPILQKFGYPFTMYIYTDYVKGGHLSGGQSMTWEQIAEMRDAGVNIGSHTVSHSALNARKGKTDEQYRQWVEHELSDSKKILEENLGIPIKTLAYPYGLHNEIVRDVAMKSGYEAAFTVYGQRLHNEGDPSMLGRYAIESTKPKIFAQAINFTGTVSTAPGQAGAPAAMPAAASMLTEPMQGETISNPRPTLKINLATLGAIDPKTVEMRISGFGSVPATYDPATQLLTYTMHSRLREKDVTVIVSARVGGRKTAASWTFHFDPNATPPPAAATPASTPTTVPLVPSPTPGDEAGIPAMQPAQ